jgi:hypothetical protein
LGTYYLVLVFDFCAYSLIFSLILHLFFYCVVFFALRYS